MAKTLGLSLITGSLQDVQDPCPVPVVTPVSSHIPHSWNMTYAGNDHLKWWQADPSWKSPDFQDQPEFLVAVLAMNNPPSGMEKVSTIASSLKTNSPLWGAELDMNIPNHWWQYTVYAFSCLLLYFIFHCWIWPIGCTNSNITAGCPTGDSPTLYSIYSRMSRIGCNMMQRGCWFCCQCLY